MPVFVRASSRAKAYVRSGKTTAQMFAKARKVETKLANRVGYNTKITANGLRNHRQASIDVKRIYKIRKKYNF